MPIKNRSGNSPKLNFIKKFLLFFTLIYGSVLALILFFQFTEFKEKSVVIDTHIKNTLDYEKKIIEDTIEHGANDLFVLTKHNELALYLNKRAPKQKRALEKEFAAFLLQKPAFDQIKLINMKGDEEIRLNNSPNGPELVGPDKLQNKATRSYFLNTLKLKKNKLFISRFELGMENGVIEQPVKPLIRLSTLLYDESGNQKAMLVLNYHGEILLDNIKQAFVNIHDHLYLINQDGYYIIGPNTANEWSFMYNEKEAGFHKDYPEIWQLIQNEQKGKVKIDAGHIHYQTISFSPSRFNGGTSPGINDKDSIDQGQYKLIVLQTDDSFFANITWQKYIYLSILAIVFGFLSFALTKYRMDKIQTRLDLLNLSKAIEAGSSMVINTDSEGNIIFVNPQFARITGHKIEDVIGENIRILKGQGKTDEEYKELWNTISSGNIWEGTFHNKKKDGSLYWSSASISPVYTEDKKLSGFVSIQDDITKQINLNKELKKSKEKAEKANRIKSEFLSNVSHELRTPLNSILGFSQLMLLDKKNIVNAAQIQNLQYIQSSGKHLLDLINDVLDLSSIEAGRLNLNIQNVNLCDVIKDVLSMVKSIPGADALIIENLILPEKPIFVLADYTRIKQVLINLASNAIKYNKVGGKVTFNCNVKKHSVFVSVQDTGHGIPKNKIKHVFEPFNRLGAQNTGVEGTGIGLTITKNIIESMQGKISFKSVENEGTTFIVEIPIASKKDHAEEHKKEKPIIAKKESGKKQTIKRKILYVEDDPVNIILMEKIISRLPGFSLITTHLGEFAFDLVTSENPDVLITDINLPDMNGIELAKKIKKIKHNLPIIALSADAPGQSKTSKADLKLFFTYMTKPFNIPEFTTTLEDSMKKVSKKKQTK
ncbi:MAG: ATP-binding protein [Leptospirales bacterium]